MCVIECMKTQECFFWLGGVVEQRAVNPEIGSASKMKQKN